MSITIGSSRYFINQPAFLLVFWLAIPLILLIYLPPIWEWVAVAASVLLGLAITFRQEDAIVRGTLAKSNQGGNPMFRDFSGKKVLAFSPESLAVFDAKPQALNAWAMGWEGWKDLKEKHGGGFFYWNSLREVNGGSPISSIHFLFEEDKSLDWRPASQSERFLTLDGVLKFSSMPMNREETQITGHYLQAGHLFLLPLILASIMVALIGIGMVNAIDANHMSKESADRGPIFWVFWEMMDQVLKIVPHRFLTEIGTVGFGLSLWAGFLLSARKHVKVSLRLKGQAEPELMLQSEKLL